MRWFKWLGALRSQLRQTLSVHLFETYVTIFGTVPIDHQFGHQVYAGYAW